MKISGMAGLGLAGTAVLEGFAKGFSSSDLEGASKVANPYSFRIDEPMKEAYQAALNILKPSKKQLEHGLELHRNSVVIGGETYALRVPSVYQSGINIQVNETVGEEGKYKILLDFDVAQSVVDHGNGSYSMNPVIRAFSAGNGGSIKGRVVPAHSSPAVYAILGTDTIASAYTDESGEFRTNVHY